MSSKGHCLLISISFVCFCVSRFVAYDRKLIMIEDNVACEQALLFGGAK